jgi:xylulokinase
VLAAASAEYPIMHPGPNQAEQNPEEWWRATVEAVRVVLAQAPGTAVAAIGLSGQMHGTVLLDKTGALVGNAIIWPDQRSARQVQEITALVGAERLYRIAGSPVSTGFQAASVRWVQQERPVAWRRVAMILAPKDYLRWRLTGAYATDPSDGAGALLLDETTRDWSGELLELLTIDPARLPPIQPAVDIAGHLLAQTGNGAFQVFTAQAKGNIAACFFDDIPGNIGLAAQAVRDGVGIIHGDKHSVNIIHLGQQALGFGGIAMPKNIEAASA